MEEMINSSDNTIKEIDENEIFINRLMNKGSFMVDWYAGTVLPKTHPRYYDDRIEVNIIKVFDNFYGKIQFGKEEYQVSDEIINILYQYVESNIDKLIKISLNQNIEMYDGGGESLRIKYKSIYMDISETNASSEEEKQEIYNIKNDIKNILTSTIILSKKETIQNGIVEDKVNEILGTGDLGKNRILIKLVNKVNDIPFDVETTIAQLMQLDNNNVVMIDPLVQGEIFSLFRKICEELNIKLEANRDDFGGLAYYYKFIKISK